MTTLLLIRHADAGAGSLIPGWQPGWHLSPTGLAQALRVSASLASVPLRAVYCSPLQRALQTAQIIAEPHSLHPQCFEDLGEIQFGEWEGRYLEELDKDPRWKLYNVCRTAVRPPGGEWAAAVQARMVLRLNDLAARHSSGTIAVVSHGDPLRYALAHYLGLPLDFILRLELSLASITTLEIADWGPKIINLNATAPSPDSAEPLK